MTVVNTYFSQFAIPILSTYKNATLKFSSIFPFTTKQQLKRFYTQVDQSLCNKHKQFHTDRSNTTIREPYWFNTTIKVKVTR